MATKKTPDKKLAKKAPSKKEAKKPTPKKKAPVKPKFIEIVYLNRTPEAIAEMRSAIINEDILAHINDIEEDYRSLLKMINKCVRPVHEDTTKWHMILKVLDSRSRNAHRLLNKVVPDFKEEELSLRNCTKILNRKFQDQRS